MEGSIIGQVRHIAAKELAEAGCSDCEIQAVTGHKSLAMVQKYRSQADQKAASERAQARLEWSGSGT
ncbi:tyrosine-type recombinase/integrase [Palleronia caenipelagi]|uniref:Site-specific integrase n=1 Tax=Palleronia caenipelagi TaxID=2489174 RepID=A0A547Q9C2_9RHOB|nr:tyrosine-type recombinase/integrase [Palleronia caenipelagi]TRD22970.1 site-specific integrase [Palleronia caenipelagi]